MIPRLDYLLDYMIDHKAADLTVVENEPISFRIKKEIYFPDKSIKVSREDINLILEQITYGNTAVVVDLYKPEEIDGSYIYKDRFFRYNISLTEYKVHLSIRYLISQLPTAEDIQMTSENDIRFRDRLVELPEGIFLVVGATGSGKSSTVTYLVDYLLKNRSIKAITLEAPIEFRFKNSEYEKSIIIQREIGRDTESFYRGLTAAMRQNPDLIYLGEIRDRSTAEAAVNAAITGHTVIATLHANSAEAAFKRLSYLLDDTFDIDSSVIAIMKQKLVVENGRLKAVREYYFSDRE